jgi:hypothetical protein
MVMGTIRLNGLLNARSLGACGGGGLAYADTASGFGASGWFESPLATIGWLTWCSCVGWLVADSYEDTGVFGQATDYPHGEFVIHNYLRGLGNDLSL